MGFRFILLLLELACICNFIFQLLFLAESITVSCFAKMVRASATVFFSSFTCVNFLLACTCNFFLSSCTTSILLFFLCVLSPFCTVYEQPVLIYSPFLFLISLIPYGRKVSYSAFVFFSFYKIGCRTIFTSRIYSSFNSICFLFFSLWLFVFGFNFPCAISFYHLNMEVCGLYMPSTIRSSLCYVRVCFVVSCCSFIFSLCDFICRMDMNRTTFKCRTIMYHTTLALLFFSISTLLYGPYGHESYSVLAFFF